MLAIAVLNALIALVLAVLVIVQRREIRSLTSEESPGGRRREVIAIEIRNHSQLATSRNFLAAPIAAVSPSLIRSIVHKETCRIVREEMVKHGVDADVRIRTMSSPPPTASSSSKAHPADEN